MLYQTKNPHGGDIYGKPIDLDYSANTNPFGTPQGILDAMQAEFPNLHCYPDPYCRRLVAAISDFERLPPTYILCANGAADLIYAYCQVVRPKTAVELAPTFSEYSLGLDRVDCVVSRYTLKQENGFVLDEDFLTYLADKCPEVLFLCNPNNPTGKLLNHDLLHRILALCREKHISLFLDECFLDLSDDGISLKTELADNQQLFILKAFTKSYGMAGVRLGYGLCANADLLTQMSQIEQPWNVSTLAQVAGVAALKEQEFLQNTKTLVQQQRQWLKTELESMGFWVCESKVNFLLFHAPIGLDAALLKRQIAIRSCDNYYGLEAGWYRIAVRLPKQNERLIAAMKEIVKEQPWQKIL